MGLGSKVVTACHSLFYRRIRQTAAVEKKKGTPKVSSLTPWLKDVNINKICRGKYCTSLPVHF